MKRLCFIGPLPPPIHGLSLINKLMIEHLGEYQIHPIILNTESKSIHRTFSNISFRFLKMIKIIGFYLYLLMSKKVAKLYISLSGGWGQIYDLVIITVSILFKIPIIIHHHSFAYLNKEKYLTRLIINLASDNAIHIVLCSRMEELLKSYNGKILTSIISNTAFIPNQTINVSNEKKEFISVGFLSNISFEKGIYEYIEVFKRLVTKFNVNGIIAGPFSDKESRIYLENSLNQANRIKYIGSVSNNDKTNFFRQVDILLFPTNYVNEAEPLVIHEAMSYGIPVIAQSRGCINQMIDSNSGIIVLNRDEYIEVAFEKISNWIMNQNELNIFKKQSFDRFNSYKKESIKNLTDLTNTISS